MNWYYAEGGKQTGPVSETEFEALVSAGKILPETLVWREGLRNWMPLAEARTASPAASGLATTSPPPPSASAPPPNPASDRKEWHYEEAGKPAGPVSESELVAMVSSGRLPSSTRVWKAGMANWLPYSAARAGTPAIPAGPDEVHCAECRQTFSRNVAIQYGTVWVCPACKPMFLQKLGQGGAPAGIDNMDYAGFWIRFGAKMLDSIIAGVAQLPVSFFLNAAIQDAVQKGSPVEATVLFAASLAIGWTVQILYNGLFVGRFGATPGKMACNLKVVTPEGARLSYGRAFGRAAAEIVSGMTCLIGYIIAGFDDEKRTLHDRIADTRVVYKS